MIVTAILLGGFGLLLYCVYRRRTQQHHLFSSLGVPGPPPHWLRGNPKGLTLQDSFKVVYEWTKQYGKTYGYYEGPTPILVTSDVELIQQIFIKQFANFNGRKGFPIQPDPDSNHEHSNIFSSNGAIWKRLRSIVNPTFSTAKLKQLLVLVEENVQHLIGDVAKETERSTEVNVLELYQELTLHTIADVAFGMDTRSQKNQPFLYYSRVLIDLIPKPSHLNAFAVLFPCLKSSLFTIFTALLAPIKTRTPYWWLHNQFKVVLKERKKQKARRQDIMQFMMDVLDDESSVSQKDAIEESMMSQSDVITSDRSDVDREQHKEQGEGSQESKQTTMQTTKRSDKSINENELASMASLFLIAGYETTSNGLAYVSYMLAKHPDVQERLVAEIDSIVQRNEGIGYYDLMSMEYLDMVIQETLRLYPVGGNAVNRKCTTESEVCGLLLPRGTVIQVDVWSMHHDPEVWGHDAEDFDPDRFSAEKKENRPALAYLPFGTGPRNCIGMRFALLEMKLTLVHMLSKFRFEVCEKTEDPLVLQEALAIRPKNGVILNVLPRRDVIKPAPSGSEKACL